MKKIKKAAIIFMGAAILLCSGWGQKTETKDGIRIIHNEKSGIWGNTPKVELHLIRTIGGIDEEDENFAFNSLSDVLLDSKGNMYILDSGNSRIQKLNPEGKFLRSIGGKGQGPGEFDVPFSLTADSEDNLYVLDVMNRRVSVFSSEGKVINTIKFKQRLFGSIRIFRPHFLITGGSPDRRALMDKNSPLPKLFKAINVDGKVEFEFGEITDYKDNLVNAFANRYGFDVDRENNLYVTFFNQNRIEKYDPKGKLNWRMDRVLNYDTKVHDKGSSQRLSGGVMTQAPKINNVSFGLSLDGQGRIWVLTFNRQMSEEETGSSLWAGGRVVKRTLPKVKKFDIFKLEIFDHDGILLGELMINHLARGVRIFGDIIFLWDAQNVTLYQYKIVDS